MKILIIGNANSFWIKEYVEYILPGSDNEVFIAGKSVVNKDFNDFYNKNNINILETNHGTFLFDRIPKLKTLVNMYRKVKKEADNGMFDVIHIHSVPSNFMVTFLNKFIVRFGKRIVCTFWGSDLLSKTKEQLMKAIPCLDKAKCISYSSDGMDRYFHDVFGDIYNDKIVRAKFGISIYDVIDKVKSHKSKDECKEFFGIEKDKISVMIGYNGSIRQNHLKVINELSTLDNETLNKLNIVIQLSYGLTSDEYRQNIIDEISKINVKHVIIDDFLNKEKSAMLRNATDIFIHAQESDAFSASIQECVYGGAVLINPEWIVYKEFDDIGIDYIKYRSFNELPLIIKDISDGNVNIYNADKVKELYEKYSWNAVKKDWLKLYK
ncbi:glycosyltransferase [uncultured Anaerofustis sp.]|uniref:glycosyltransferase n=1 Tax=uncultured Anaerofustis sp. TaxID=904996 RepID=UPI0025D4623D|nr:glycosyltransferase [uncultured Anaerofustis sp.]